MIPFCWWEPVIPRNEQQASSNGFMLHTDPRTNKELNDSESVLISNRSLQEAITKWKRNAENAKLGQIISTDQIQNLILKKGMNDERTSFNSAVLENQDVTVIKRSECCSPR